MNGSRHHPRSRASFLLASLVVGGCWGQPGAPASRSAPREAAVLSAEQALGTFSLPPGYRIEIVAVEPLVQDPVAIDFDPEGRMYVVEMRGYMPALDGAGEDRPVGRVVVLEDVDDDGRMDRKTVFLDGLVLPRAVRVLEQGVLVAAPPYLWLVRDTDGDLRADSREVIRDDYGDPASNPQHNASGLLWGLDNWIHSADYGGQLRLRDGRFEHRSTAPLGQWGISMDDHGRLYRNSNEDPLRADLVPAHYFARNPDLVRSRGAYERLAEKGPVWPIRPTPGVNRGYRSATLREDSTLAHFTAAGAPTVFLGDRLPAELRENVFVVEPAGNLVRRFRVDEDAEGGLVARNAYDRAEFLTSTDERFRPVNLYSAPDGTLYVVDMYRGIIEHRDYLTGYLEQQIHARGLEKPIGLGRIYRVVHESTTRAARPAMSSLEPSALVARLSHPNGWWSGTAQRLLVERAERSVAPELRELVHSAEDERTRLRALWTLEGIGAIDPRTLQSALQDPSPGVRAAAIRLSEPWLAGAEHPLLAAVLRMRDDPDRDVRRQLTASIGELPTPSGDATLLHMLGRFGEDPVIVDLAVSGLGGREMPFLERLLEYRSPVAGERTDAVEILTATVVKGGDAEDFHRLIRWTGEESRPPWQRVALLDGIAAALPSSDDPDAPVQRRALTRTPSGLFAASTSPDAGVRARAEALLPRLEWPGKPQEAGRALSRPLTEQEQLDFVAGERQYLASCAGCHRPEGTGVPGVAKPLVGSGWVLGAPGRLIRILLHGKEGEMLMPPVGGQLSDLEIAAVSTYLRRAWGHRASPVAESQVREVRGQTAGRTRAWTEGELASVRR